MAAVLVDAGPMLAAFGARQPRASHYLDLFRRAADLRWSLSTTWPCVVEAGYLLSPPQRFTFLRWVGAGAIAVFPFPQEALDDFVALMQRYTQSPAQKWTWPTHPWCDQHHDHRCPRLLPLPAARRTRLRHSLNRY